MFALFNFEIESPSVAQGALQLPTLLPPILFHGVCRCVALGLATPLVEWLTTVHSQNGFLWGIFPY